MGLVWIRNEVKAFEKRTPLIPSHTQKLVQQGHHVVVERSQNRIFSDQEYATAGCHLADQDQWLSAPSESIILGIKHLPKLDKPLIHRHLYFAYAYDKHTIFDEDDGVISLMKNFQEGGGIIYDLSLMRDQQNKRVVFFGTFAGNAAALIALSIWFQKKQKKQRPYLIPSGCDSIEKSINTLSCLLHDCKEMPKEIIVIGANGHCGQGVCSFLKQLKLPFLPWSRNDTASPTAYLQLLSSDIIFNCVRIDKPISPFLKLEQLKENQNLSVIMDITCETKTFNPLPIYEGYTNYDNPSHCLHTNSNPIDLVAIDNLPSLFSHESSTHFSTQLLPHLQSLLEEDETYPCQTAKNIFHNMVLRF